MKLVVFGATGMVGKAALLEALDDVDVDAVVAVVRKPIGLAHAKLSELAHDFTNVDGVLWCLGASSVGMSEADYTRLTYDFAVAAARAIRAQSPAARFCFVSGAGTNAKSTTMWSRVKGTTENELRAIFGGNAFCFRPGIIEPQRGVTPSATPWLKTAYAVFRPLFFVLRHLPAVATTSTTLGRGLVRVAVTGVAKKPILESVDINALGP
jgi:uncharacterized protein YbjT (DUF2867 family)